MKKNFLKEKTSLKHKIMKKKWIKNKKLHATI